MAAVRTESDAFGDVRYERLARLAGLADADHARGKMARLWRQCTMEKRYVLPIEDVIEVLGERAIAALTESRLGEEVDGGVRIRGTKGRIEWLDKLRKNGRKGGRPKKTKCKPSGSGESNPLALLCSGSATAPVRDPDQPPLPPLQGGSSEPPAGRKGKAKAKKPKPEPTPAEHETAMRVLGKLGDRTGIAYEGRDSHVRLIAHRLRDGISERDLRGIAAYCWSELGWSGKPEMQKFLRPETLYGPSTIGKYLDGARSWLAKNYPEERQATPPQPSTIGADLFSRHGDPS